MLFICFKSIIKFHIAFGGSGCFLINSIFLLSKMKSLFFKLWTKICKILYLILESTSPFSFKFCIIIQCHQTQVFCTFFSSNIISFGQKQPNKMQIFEIFKCSCQCSSNSSCQFWIDKSVPLQILYHSSLSWHITPL